MYESAMNKLRDALRLGKIDEANNIVKRFDTALKNLRRSWRVEFRNRRGGERGPDDSSSSDTESDAEKENTHGTEQAGERREREE